MFLIKEKFNHIYNISYLIISMYLKKIYIRSQNQAFFLKYTSTHLTYANSWKTKSAMYYHY